MIYLNKLITLFQGIIIVIISPPYLFAGLIDLNNALLLDYPFKYPFTAFAILFGKLYNL
jgi:hypothetical protein